MGSAGGNLTVAACCWVAVGGAATLGRGGGSGCDVCGGGSGVDVVGVGGAACIGTLDSVTLGASTTLGASFFGAGAPPSKQIY